MNITKIVETVHRREVIKFFVDGIQVAVCVKYRECFCTVDRQGRPSRLRNKYKWAKEIRWDAQGLVQLLGEEVRDERGYGSRRNDKDKTFVDVYPDLTWGYSGAVLTAKAIKEKIEQYRNL